MITLPRGTVAVRIAVVLLASVLAALTLRSALAFMFAAGDPEKGGPEIALKIDPHNSDAMAAAGDYRLQTVDLGPEAESLRKFSRETLEQSPYQVVALRNMAMILVAQDNEQGALKLINVASRISLRDYLTHAWLLGYLFRTNRIVDSVREADILLKQRQETWDVVLPALIALTRDDRVIEPLSRTLATKPYWRGDFLLKMGTVNIAPDASFAIFSRLKALGAPAQPDELAPYFRSAAATKMAPAALYEQWRALLPADAGATGNGLLRDGDFAGLRAPDPFNWRLFPGDGIYAERGAGPSGMGNALYVSYAGSRDTQFATQRLVLSPGSYSLRGRSYGDEQGATGFFQWTVRCIAPGHEGVLGQVAIDPQAAQFINHDLRFVVPAGCDQQEFAIEGKPGDPTADHIAMYLDSLKLTRLP